MLTIEYCPELNIYRVHTGKVERVVAPSELAAGGQYHQFAEVFARAKAASESREDCRGIAVEV